MSGPGSLSTENVKRVLNVNNGYPFNEVIFDKVVIVLTLREIP